MFTIEHKRFSAIVFDFIISGKRSGKTQFGIENNGITLEYNDFSHWSHVSINPESSIEWTCNPSFRDEHHKNGSSGVETIWIDSISNIESVAI